MVLDWEFLVGRRELKIPWSFSLDSGIGVSVVAVVEYGRGGGVSSDCPSRAVAAAGGHKIPD